MKRYLRKVVVIVGIAALAVSLLVGSALAAAGEPPNDATNSGRLAQMVQWMGPENWGQMIQQMTQIHGAEWTAQMLQHMNESGGSCDGSGAGNMKGHGFGGMMGQRFNGLDAFGGMMGRR